MIAEIEGVLTATELERLRELAGSMAFVSGLETAGSYVQGIKNNEQISVHTPERVLLHRIILGALARHKEFNSLALPQRVRPPLISRYRAGMSYGKHVDSALMGPKDARDRTDISVTLFLSNPNEYQGGELLIHTSAGTKSVKLQSGSAVIYPSLSLHEVTEVTQGERLVAVTWVQSHVRDDRQREILINLSRVREKLNRVAAHSVEADLIHQAHANLLRMWADT